METVTKTTTTPKRLALKCYGFVIKNFALCMGFLCCFDEKYTQNSFGWCDSDFMKKEHAHWHLTIFFSWISGIFGVFFFLSYVMTYDNGCQCICASTGTQMGNSQNEKQKQKNVYEFLWTWCVRVCASLSFSFSMFVCNIWPIHTRVHVFCCCVDAFAPAFKMFFSFYTWSWLVWWPPSNSSVLRTVTKYFVCVLVFFAE